MGGIVTAATTLARRQAACPYPSHSSGAIAATTLARRQAACPYSSHSSGAIAATTLARRQAACLHLLPSVRCNHHCNAGVLYGDNEETVGRSGN